MKGAAGVQPPQELIQKFRAANPGVRGAFWGMLVETAGRSPEDIQRLTTAAEVKLRLDCGMSSADAANEKPVPETEAVSQWVVGRNSKTLLALLHERHTEGQPAMLF